MHERPAPQVARATAALAVTALLIAGAGASTGRAQMLANGTVRVNPTAGNDANCVVNPANEAQACRTLARGVQLASQRITSPSISLSTGLHVVDAPIVAAFPNTQWTIISGAGGAQTVIRLTGAGRLDLTMPRGNLANLVMAGDAPGTWLSMHGGMMAQNLAVVRPRADAPTVLVENGTLSLSSITATGTPNALVVRGQSGVHNVTVSGGRIVLDDTGVNGTGLLNGVVASRGVTTWGGTPWIYNSALSSPASAGEPALVVGQRPAAVGAPSARNAPMLILSSLTQNGCIGAVGIEPGAVTTRAIIAGSLVQWPQCGQSVSRLPNAGGAQRTEVAWQSSMLWAPVPTAPAVAKWGSPQPGAMTDTGTTVLQAPAAGTVVTGGQWPGGLLPVAGSPLLNAATDPLSADAGINFPCSLTTTGPGCRERGQALDVLRPANRLSLSNPAPDVGAYEWSRLLNPADAPALPAPAGIAVVPGGPGGEPAPAINGVEGAVEMPGAPVAGVDTGQVLPSGSSRPVAKVSVVAPATVRLGQRIAVRVRVGQASRITVVLRRALAHPTAKTATRVVGVKAVRVKRAGRVTVSLPLNSGARAGVMAVSASAKQPGYEPGYALTSTRVR